MRTLALVCLLAATVAAPAQPAKSSTPVSPEVHPDRKVTFRVRAPKATEVTLTADWQASGAEKMTKDDAGVWSITVGPLEPGPAIYNVNIDGVAVPDPINPRVKLRAQTSASIVDVNDNVPSPGLMFGPLCAGFAPCVTELLGSPFNCASITGAAPSTSGASLVSAFTQVDAATTGDSVITNRQTGK